MANGGSSLTALKLLPARATLWKIESFSRESCPTNIAIVGGAGPFSSFFRIQRDTLRSLAPRNRHNPSVVLLTPGPHNETYFEHDFLARYLGFTLVEGGDLTVRDPAKFT